MNEHRITEIEQAAKHVPRTILSSGAPIEWIDEAQKVLGLRFPRGLCAFLHAHSGAIVRGVELYGLSAFPKDLLPGADIVYMTQLLRQAGLEKRWLAIHDDQGDRRFFLDCELSSGAEGKVYVEDLETNPRWRVAAEDYLSFVRLLLDGVAGNFPG